ncbi:protein of unknown function [Oribacterium sp. KHPX15]|uniref:DUF4430 domain-containing protein n=1 Tax=unclassified Oribacterium TaxID=2629782 RepID=UPI00067872B7|nr:MULTISPECIES: DUF4430 domain-containing protein [unclassified Oribacterium]SEA86085.1 protein of unknown function [Oribacterium sp. KHPX15]
MNKKLLYIKGISAFIICIICFLLIYIRFSPKPDSSGQKAYTLEVSDGEKSNHYSGRTDAEYLSGLLDELKNTEDFIYESTSSDYGMYITSVNGLKADDSKKTYWAIYVNGEYGQYGANSQPVNDGDTYALKLESYE